MHLPKSTLSWDGSSEEDGSSEPSESVSGDKGSEVPTAQDNQLCK